MATGQKVTIRLVTIPAGIATTVAESAIVAGNTYQIASIGTSVFTKYGATANVVGLTFVANQNSVASGTGTVVLLTWDGQLEFNSLTAVPFNYDGANWNSTADEPLSSSGILPLVNVIAAGSFPTALVGTTGTGDNGVNCQVKIEDYYSFDVPNLTNAPLKLDAYDVTFSFGASVIPATSHTLDWFITGAEAAVNAVLTGTYPVGGGEPIVGPTGPYVF